MPHISVKMLKGRTEEQKQAVSQKLAESLCEVLGCGEGHVSVTVEDFSAEEWQDVFASDITAKEDKLYKKPSYDPKSLL